MASDMPARLAFKHTQAAVAQIAQKKNTHTHTNSKNTKNRLDDVTYLPGKV